MAEKMINSQKKIWYPFALKVRDIEIALRLTSILN